MRRFYPLIFSLVVTALLLYGADRFLTSKVEAMYAPVFGDELNNDKNQGIILQKVALERGDSIAIYGSSELSGTYKPTHPVTFFAADDDGIQVNLIGRGYSQSLIHLLNFGALGETLKGKKLMLIISPQWFSKHGLTADHFQMNFSEQHYLAFMNNGQIDAGLKAEVAGRVEGLLNPKGNPEVRYLNGLYATGAGYAQALIAVLNPYFELKEYLLSARDKVRAYELLAEVHPSKRKGKYSRETVNWDEERKAAISLGKKQAANNSFHIENGYYNEYLRDKLAEYQGSMKSQSYLESPEYKDFELLLRLCRELEVKPLFVSVPVNGWWYDYCGFEKKDRKQYYENIRRMISAYGFELADFSEREYDPYFLQDSMHLGWKGWVDINEAMVSYFE